MTCIAQSKTKKAFKVEVKENYQFPIEDPSIIRPFYGAIDLHPSLQTKGRFITVTNHPKRSWFALVRRMPDGSLKVE